MTKRSKQANPKRDTATNAREKDNHNSKPAPIDGSNRVGIRAMTDTELGKARSVDPDLDNREFSALVREPQDFFHHGYDLRVVAVNGKTYSGPKHAIMPEAIQLHWHGQLNAARSPHPEIVAATMPVWRSAKIQVDSLFSRDCLALKQSDAETEDAFNAALFQTCNTACGPCDLTSAAFAIAAFVHAHPRFKDIVADIPYKLPFGKDTALALFRGVPD